MLSHLRLGLNMHEHLGASTPAIKRLRSLFHMQADEDRAVSIAKINRLFLLTLPAHLQINNGQALDPSRRDALRAKIIKSTLGQSS